MTTHRHSWEIPGTTVQSAVVLDDWLGPVAALITCTACQAHAIIYLIAWEAPVLSNRIFALRKVSDDAALVYLRNISSDYCDLDRKQSETDALLSAAEPVSLLIAATGNLEVQEVSETDMRPSFIPWREIDTAEYPLWKKAVTR